MNYADPNITQRQIVQQSLDVATGIITALDAQIAAAKATQEQPIDYITAQVVNQHVSVLQGNRATIVAEQTRLSGILAAWDAETSA